MAKRKPDPALSSQLDMFGDAVELDQPVVEVKVEVKVEPRLPLPKPANDSAAPTLEAEASELVLKISSIEPNVSLLEEAKSKLPLQEVGTSNVWLNDEWWTTAMVCAYLKLGRKAIWERHRNPRLHFPKPHHFGSMRPRWKSDDVRAWARDSLGKN